MTREESLHAFACARHDVRMRGGLANQHCAIQRHGHEQIGELLGGALRIRCVQRTAAVKCCEPGGDGGDHSAGCPIEIHGGKLGEVAGLSDQESPQRYHVGPEDAEGQVSAERVQRNWKLPGCEALIEFGRDVAREVLGVGDHVFQDLSEERFLVRVVVVDGPLGDPGTRGDFLDGRPCIAFLQEQCLAGLQYCGFRANDPWVGVARCQAATDAAARLAARCCTHECSIIPSRAPAKGANATMTSSANVRTAATGTGLDGTGLDRWLLGLGVVVGPFYLGLGLIQALVREGFEFARHPLSVLANGPGGWVQTANFLLTGLMVVAAAIGFGRMPRRHLRAASWILGCYGVCIIAAAIFPADPVDGFPPGTPKGFPTSISTTGLLHFAVGALGFLSLAVSCIAVAIAMWRRRDARVALLSLCAGLVVAGGFFGPMVLPIPGGIAGIWLSVVVGWIWLAGMSAYLSLGVAQLPPNRANTERNGAQ